MTENGDDAADERRLFGERRAETTAFVASRMGVARVDLAGGRVGRFSLTERCTARSIAATGERVVIGTDEDVLLGTIGNESGFVPTEFGPAVAVGIDDGTVFAANSDGKVGRLDVIEHGAGFDRKQWGMVGNVSGPNRFDGNILGADSGVYLLGTEIDPLGLDAVLDVAHTGRTPDDLGTSEGSETFAATEDGLYRRTDEWEREFDEPATVVSCKGSKKRAVTGDGTVLARDDDTWEEIDFPEDRSVVDLAHPYAVTSEGEFFVAAEDDQTSDGIGGWRSRMIGIHGVAEMAVPEESTDNRDRGER